MEVAEGAGLRDFAAVDEEQWVIMHGFCNELRVERLAAERPANGATTGLAVAMAGNAIAVARHGVRESNVQEADQVAAGGGVALLVRVDLVAKSEIEWRCVVVPGVQIVGVHLRRMKREPGASGEQRQEVFHVTSSAHASARGMPQRVARPIATCGARPAASPAGAVSVRRKMCASVAQNSRDQIPCLRPGSSPRSSSEG